MLDLLVPQTMFSLAVVLTGSLATCAAATFYMGRVRLERPAIGVFNGRDLFVLFFFITTLPALYLALPDAGLTAFLLLTFVAALSIGYKPVLPPVALWTGIGVLLGGNIWLTYNMLGTVLGWQVYWAATSFVVLLAAAAIANLYVQGGMKMRHVAWFALLLGVYDVVFSIFIPLTPRLADAFIGNPLDPSIGMRLGIFNANIGIGDLLVYGLFTIAALKAYGRKAAWAAVAVVAFFGSAAPALAPLAIDAVTRGGGNVVVPAQAFFGIPAFILYQWMRRHWGRERTMEEYIAVQDANRIARRGVSAAPVSPAPALPTPAGVGAGRTEVASESSGAGSTVSSGV